MLRPDYNSKIPIHMIRNELVDAVIPSPEQVLDLIVSAERHQKVVWTAGRLLKEMALWTLVERLRLTKSED